MHAYDPAAVNVAGGEDERFGLSDLAEDEDEDGGEIGDGLERGKRTSMERNAAGGIGANGRLSGAGARRSGRLVELEEGRQKGVTGKR